MMSGSPHCAHDTPERAREIVYDFLRGIWAVAWAFTCMTFPSIIPSPRTLEKNTGLRGGMKQQG
jgi:hypothetical protein